MEKQEGSKGWARGERRGGREGDRSKGQITGWGWGNVRELGWEIARYDATVNFFSNMYLQDPPADPLNLEYQNALDPTLGPAYREYALGLSFACTVEIPSHSTSFGSPNNAFSTKKAARSNAAREAVQFLISEGLTNPNGTPKARNKKAKLGTAVRIEEQGMEVKKGTTYAQRVNSQSDSSFGSVFLLSTSPLSTSVVSKPTSLSTHSPPPTFNPTPPTTNPPSPHTDLCPLLGLPSPIYRFAATSPSAPNILSGTACFPANPILPGQYGEIRNVFGKKNAKEECSRGLWEVLRELARGRGVAVGEMEEEM